MIKKTAFTLYELIIVLAIVSILSAVAIPACQSWIMQGRRDAVIYQLYHALFLARSSAIRYRAIVTICPSRDGYDCDMIWNQGYMVITGNPERPERILKVFSPRSGTLSWHGYPQSPYLQMTAQGFTNHQNGTFYYCPANRDPHFAKAIFVIQSGRVRLSQDKNHDGIDEDSEGKPLHCF